MKKNQCNRSMDDLEELSPEECARVSGGAFPWFVTGAAGLLGYLAKKCVDDWQCFKDGLAGNWSTHGATHSK